MRGARVADVGLLGDGRFGIVLRRRAGSRVLAVDAFASPPLVTLEDGELGILVEPGFVRAAAAALRGMVLVEVRARRGDRVLRMSFGSRSRFGVDDRVEVYLELVPRFGNIVLVKRDTVVAAAKEFSLAENERRAVQPGLPYQPPPLPAEAPQIPKAVERSGVARDEFLVYAQSDAALTDPIHVYRRNGVLLQAHLVPLAGFEDAEHTREPSLLDAFAEFRGQAQDRGERERTQQRRDRIRKLLERRERKTRDELAAIADRRRRAGERDALRIAGEDIYARLHALPAVERDDEKLRAAALFAQYKKLGASLSHLERREADLQSQAAMLEELRWEAERVASEDLGELDEAVARLAGRAPSSAAPARRRRRVPLEVRTPAGSRIVVGRSPVENAHVTFVLARPGDLWFHARGVPGAHVILSRDDRSEPPAEDVAAAASLAAQHSKAKASAKVAVDYTLRKYVRKQRNAAPGLVWYTNAKTITAVPSAAPVPPEDDAAPRAQHSGRGKELRT